MNQTFYPLTTRAVRRIQVALYSTFGLFLLDRPAHAQIIADKNVPSAQQATILSAPNGVPLVNIQTPSTAGVSRNSYSQFDVQRQGVILNNSAANTQTQLGGWVQGNPWLAGGTARIILNEVNSSNPSLLFGYTEVAGSRAQVIIANPSGISCDGCGFINAYRGTLTTGAPIVNGGNLEGYRVAGGTLTIKGTGLDASTTDYTDLIARSIQVNAGIWANQLKLSTGMNQINAAHTEITRSSIDGSTNAPLFSIDVAQLGGMYAGKIILVGTEDGVGMRNAGQIGASVGEVQVTLEGKLINSGILNSKREMQLDAKTGMTNTGVMAAQGNLTLNAAAADIDNTKALIYSAAELRLSAQKIINSEGTLIAGIRLKTDSISLSGDGKLFSQGDMQIRLRSDYSHTGQLLANGSASLTTTGKITNSASMVTGTAIALKAAGIENTDTGSIQGGDVDLVVTDSLTDNPKRDVAFNNRGMIDGKAIHIASTTLNNIGSGRIYGDHIAIQATTLNNIEEADKAAVIAAREQLDVGATRINNREGASLFSAGDMAIGGTLDSNVQASGKADTVNNDSATIEALGKLRLSAVNLNNTNQHLSTALELTSTLTNQREDVSSTYYRVYTRKIYTPKIITTAPAKILAGGDLNLDTDTTVNYASQIIAGGNLDIAGNSVSNTGANVQSRLDDSGTAYTLVHIPQRGNCGYIQYKCVRAHDEWDPAPYSNTSFQSEVIGLGVTLPHTASSGSGSGSGIVINPLATSAVIQVASVNTNNAGDPAIVVRTGGSQTSLPVSSLFSQTTQADSHYLIETDARFANYRNWLSSDYLLQALSSDPATMQKRLGDGYYEQKLIREQVAQLTGRRFLQNYASDEAQYQDLMDHAVGFASTYHLRPGIALSAEQMAALTSDIIWLVETDIVLADGSTTKVLYPQLYVRVQDSDLIGNGALMAGGSVKMNLSGDLNNSRGAIAGRQIVSLNAQNINNLGSRITGDIVLAQAGNDLNNIGGRIDASQALVVTAGRDLNVTTTTQSASSTTGSNTYSRTTTDRVAGLYVTGSQDSHSSNLIALAGRDVNLTAAEVVNQQNNTTVIAAGRDLTLGIVTVGETSNIIWDRNNYLKEARKTEVGSNLQTQGNLQLSAGQDIRIKAANVTSQQGTLELDAGRNVDIVAGESQIQVDEAHKKTTHSLLSSTTLTTHDTLNQKSAQSSTVSGNVVNIQAGQNLRVSGSNVVSTEGSNLMAERQIAIEAATNTRDETHYRNEKTSGLMGSGGFGITIGTRTQSLDNQSTGTGAVASTIGSIKGDVNLQAAQDYRQTGSDVIAPQGNVNISAQRVNIEEARENINSDAESKFKQTGITLAVSSPVITAIQTAQQMAKASSQTKDSRMQVLAAANTAMAAKEAYKAVQAGQGSTINGSDNQIKTGTDANGQTTSRDTSAADKVGGFTVSLSLGTSSSNSKTTQTSSNASGSNVTAGQDVRIMASGGGTQSDIAIQGSNVKAGRSVQLQADHAIALVAAQNTAGQHSKNSSSSASIGVAISSNGGIGVIASGSLGRGNADGNDVSWSNTHVSGQQASLASGSDTTLKGAVVNAEQITTRTGGNLHIESLQDSSTYDSRQKEVSGGVMVGSGVSGNLALSNSKVDSTYSSVVEQSGLRAGDGGFTVQVQGDTRLTGGAITSTQQAVDQQRNQFETGGTLSTSDLQNKADYKASAVSANIGAGQSPSGKLAPTGTGAGMGSDSDHDASVTQAAISNLAGNKQARSGDKETGIAKIFDAQAVQQDINAQVQITQSFSMQASKVVGDYVGEQRKGLQVQLKEASNEKDKQAIQMRLSDLKTEERVMNILIGGVTGLAGAAVTKEALSAAADQMRELMITDSKKFVGITDGKTTLSNISGESAGVRGDGFKIGGTRVDLDLLCGADNRRCLRNDDGSLKLNGQGQVQFNPEAAGNRSLAEYLQSADAKDIPGLTGGIQGAKGTLFGVPYASSSWQDKLIEAFSGTHDMIGGKVSGLYDEQGNAVRGRTTLEVALHNRWSEIAIPISTPFAAAEVLSPEMWQALSILLKAAK